MAFIELVVSTTAFWKATGAVFRANNPRTGGGKDNRMKEALIRLPHARVTWICAIFLLGYVGIEVALGGWIVKWSVTHFLSISRHHANAPQYVPLCFTNTKPLAPLRKMHTQSTHAHFARSIANASQSCLKCAMAKSSPAV